MLHRYENWQVHKGKKTKTKNPHKHTTLVFWKVIMLSWINNTASKLCLFSWIFIRELFSFSSLFLHKHKKEFQTPNYAKKKKKRLEFQRRRGDSRKFIIKAEIFFTTPQFGIISSSHFWTLHFACDAVAWHRALKNKARGKFSTFVGTGFLSFLLSQPTCFLPVTRKEHF